MENDGWTTGGRLSSSTSKRYQSRSVTDPSYLGFEEIDVDEDPRMEFPCPFCTEDFDIIGLCCHIDDEHPVEAKNGVCPVCGIRVGLDMVGHIALQHGQFFKMQRKRRFRKGGSQSGLSLLRKELRDGSLQSLLGGSAGVVSSTNAAPDPLLSSFINNLPMFDEPKTAQPESLRKETDIASRERREKLETELKQCQKEVAELTEIWEKQRAEMNSIKEVKEELDKARFELEQAQRENNFARAGELRYSVIPSLEAKVPQENTGRKEISQENDFSLVHEAVTADDIAAVVSRVTGIPVTKLNSGTADRLLRMESTLRESIRGQDEALKAVANAVRLQRAGLNGENRPLASFFFLGPTGVGKTELCKKMANFLFSTDGAMVRFDMSEFQEKHTISRLIGSPAGYVGYEDAGQLTEAVRRKPYAVLLFDEFEKAHKDISALLLQVLDEGFLTDSQGHRVDFRNTLIVFTSNLGADIIVGQNSNFEYSEAANGELSPGIVDAVINIVKSSYAPEFLNRIDEFIIFKRLSIQALREIVDIRLRELQKRLDDRRIKLVVGDDVRLWLAQRGYDPKFGARPLNRLISKHIGNNLAENIIKGHIRTGSIAHVKLSGEELVIFVEN